MTDRLLGVGSSALENRQPGGAAGPDLPTRPAGPTRRAPPGPAATERLAAAPQIQPGNHILTRHAEVGTTCAAMIG